MERSRSQLEQMIVNQSAHQGITSVEHEIRLRDTVLSLPSAGFILEAPECIHKSRSEIVNDNLIPASRMSAMHLCRHLIDIRS